MCKLGVGKADSGLLQSSNCVAGDESIEDSSGQSARCQEREREKQSALVTVLLSTLHVVFVIVSVVVVDTDKFWTVL